tara:strand:- start:6 stop:506 length:501 start_codon:yes stop_codon:yes gene_type:complete
MGKTIIKEYKQEGFDVVYSYEIDEYERPNDIWEIFTPADYHEAGITIQYLNAGRDCPKHYTSCNYTPAQLAKEYAAQGRANPSKEAYDSLQKELSHYLDGICYSAIVEIKRAGIVLATDCIGSDYSDNYGESLEDNAIQCAKEHFCIKDLISQARVEAGKLLLQLA